MMAMMMNLLTPAPLILCFDRSEKGFGFPVSLLSEAATEFTIFQPRFLSLRPKDLCGCTQLQRRLWIKEMHLGG